MKQICPPRASMSLKFRRNCAAGRKAVLHSQGGLVSWLRSPEVAAKRGMASFLKRLRCATGMPASGRRENCFHSFCVCRRELCEVFDKLKKVREIVDFTNFLFMICFSTMSSLYGASAQSTAAPQGAPAGSVSIPFPALHGKSPASNRRFIAAAPGAGGLRPHTQLVRRVPAGAQFCCKRGVHSTIAINVADKIRKPHITIGAVKFAGAVAEYDAALIEAAFFPASTVDISDGNAKTGNESMAPRDFICAQARMVHIAAPQAAESTDCKILLYALAARPAGRPQRHRHTGRDNGLAGGENNFKHSAAASFQKMGERDARSPIHRSDRVFAFIGLSQQQDSK